METANKLIYSSTKFFTENGNEYRIRTTVSLNDDCHNNICDWSITADVDWKNKHGKYEDYLGGCCHDEVAKHFPELSKFISLHLCNHYGAPMYPVENGIYHVRRSGMSVAMEYLRISEQECVELYKASKARTELSYRDIWGAFKNLMGYIEFFDMGTPQRLLKKSANEWFGNNHELSLKSDKIKREHARELKRIFQILLNHQALEVLGAVNVIVDEVCGEGTWAKYTIRCQRWTEGCEKREAIVLEKARKEEEARNKTLEEWIQMWKYGEISQLSYYCRFEN